MEFLKMVLFLIIYITSIVLLIRLHEKIFEYLGIYRLLNKLWKKIAEKLQKHYE